MAKRSYGTLGVLTLALLIAAGCSEDAVDQPFFTDSRLVPVDCPAETSEVECFELVTEVFDHGGTAEAERRVYALADDFSTDLGEVARFTGFTIRSGDRPVFSVIVPASTPEGFLRWQASCSPGAPG